jgi:1-phosphofructokinase
VTAPGQPRRAGDGRGAAQLDLTRSAAAPPPGKPEGRAVVFAPSPWLEVLLGKIDAGPEVHLHAAGQGFWIGRLLHVLGVQVTMCSTFGGETGEVTRALMSRWATRVREVRASASNGCTVRDGRTGVSADLLTLRPGPLGRHEADDLYGVTLVEGLDSDVVVLGGSDGAAGLVDPDIYCRLASDLHNAGRQVLADLSGEQLDAVLDGGVSMVKASAEDLQADGRLSGCDLDEVFCSMAEMQRRGAENVVVTCADKGAAALLGSSRILAGGPHVAAVEARGAGDSLSAGLAAGMAMGRGMEAALRLGVAAATLNVTRHGLATGTREEIERLADHVELQGKDD